MSDAGAFERLLAERCRGFAEVGREAAGVLWAHFELMGRWNRKLNLTSVADMKGAVVRHYAESLFLASLVPATVRTVADVGSGAGFPGFPIAVLRRGAEVTLVESDQRKAAFLREVSDLAGNVKVRCCRAEQLRGAFDAVVGRAVRVEVILETAARVAGWVGILMARADGELLATEVAGELRPLPWDGASVALTAHVPRETSRTRD